RQTPSMSSSMNNHTQSSVRAMGPTKKLVIPNYSAEHKAACVSSNGKPLCYECKRENHRVHRCWKLMKAQGIPLPEKPAPTISITPPENC
ncbi:unnamed protein product, partial [Allacma fusca]